MARTIGSRSNIPNATWDTPIWKANRRANFMLTQDKTAHPWLFEDAGSAAGRFRRTGLQGGRVFRSSHRRRRTESGRTSARSGRSCGRPPARFGQNALHFQLTLAAQDARMAQGDETAVRLVTQRIEALLKKDAG